MNSYKERNGGRKSRIPVPPKIEAAYFELQR